MTCSRNGEIEHIIIGPRTILYHISPCYLLYISSQQSTLEKYASTGAVFDIRTLK